MLKTKYTDPRLPNGLWTFTIAEGWWILSSRFKEIGIKYFIYQKKPYDKRKVYI